MTGPFLLEIATEEIPAFYLAPALQSLKISMEKEFKDKNINFKPLTTGGSPRRMALFSEEVALVSRREEKEIKGPPQKMAFENGLKPTKILEKFLESNQLRIEDIEIKKTDKGEYVFASKSIYHGETADILSQSFKNILLNIVFPKKMHWHTAEPMGFARPIRNILLLLNNQQVKVLGLDSIPQEKHSQKRFYLNEGQCQIESLQQYFEHLNNEKIIIDLNQKSKFIKEKAENEASKINGFLYSPDKLLAEVTNLVETPYPGLGTFESDFLRIPDPVLISVMLDHQKYFPIQDQEGKLLNSFVFIANQPVTEKIIKGNERVIRARFKDAEFFFNEDQKIRLDKLHAKLDGLMFTKESGTMLDKSKRVAQILNILIPFFALSEDEIEQSFRAAFLAKTDLLTHLVFEFPELQGKIGSILALAQGENEGTARAILEQYLPLGSGSELPATRVGAIISIAEKFDNLITLFLNGKIPTGSADPYALRRQTSAILEILVKFEVRLDLSKITRQIIGDIEQNILHKPSADGKSKALIELLDFIKKRAWTILEGKKFTFDEIDAFQNGAHLDIYLGIKKLESIQEIKKGYNFKPLILTFKRIHNILTAARKKAEKIPAEIKPSLLQDKEEQELFQVRDALEGEIRKYLQEESFAKAIDTMIQLRPPIDQFFEKVMVMAEDSQLRQNRLALLEKIETLFLDFLDLSRIQE